MIGQVRGFDVNEFLSDWEQPGQALPWALGDSAWVSERPSAPSSASQRVSRPGLPSRGPAPGAVELDVVEGLHAAGVSTQLKVMYVPDYVPLQARTLELQTLSQKLGQLLPGYELSIAIADVR